MDCFDTDLDLTDADQISQVRLVLEHSYLGDLDIELISPSGQVIFLQTQGGFSANLGEPWATGTVDGSSNNTTPGIGYQYCFVPDDTFPTLTEGVQDGGTFVSGDGQPPTSIHLFQQEFIHQLIHLMVLLVRL